jgi:hypothetical protein
MFQASIAAGVKMPFFQEVRNMPILSLLFFLRFIIFSFIIFSFIVSLDGDGTC